MIASPSPEPVGTGVLADPRRVAAVRRVLAAGVPPSALDRLTRLAAELLGAPFAQVSLLAEEQVIASIHGLQLPPEQRTGPWDDSVGSVTLLGEGPLAVADGSGDGRVAHLPPVVRGLVRSYLGVPLVDSAGLILGSLCVYGPTPRQWTPADVGILVEIAASVVSELELRALATDLSRSSLRLDLALSAADIGSFDLDLQTGRLEWDDRLLALFGYDRDTFAQDWDSFARRVHPEDLPSVDAAVQRAVASAGDFSAEYRIVPPDGRVRWIQARGRVLAGSDGRPGRLLGAAFDYTELRSNRDQLARLLETMTDAFFALDTLWRFTYVNAEAERVLARRREDLLGRQVWEQFPEALGTGFEVHYRRAMRTGEMVSFEEYYPPLDVWFEVRAWPGPDGLSVYFHDITDRRRAQEAAAAANERLALLADASARLSASLEPQQVLRTLTELLVPRFGRWAAVALLTETAGPLADRDSAHPGSVQVVGVRHVDPGREKELAERTGRLALSTQDPAGPGAVIRTGRPEWHGSGPDPTASESPGRLTVPLASRGRRLGAVTVGAPEEDRAERALLLDLATRAGVALDNALLYGAERRTGITLQRSLLPRDLPCVPGLDLAARYLPGATGAYIGGDWYQGVPVGPGVVLAMGDVMGHGMRSAARMGQLRAIVATLALEGHPPGELLRRLSTNSRVLLDLELATLLVASYDPQARRLTLASAGHPPPLVAPEDAQPWYPELTPGPPIGTVPGDYPQTEVEVPPGARLVFYTDGLVENRGESLDAGMARLREALQDAPESAEGICDRVLAALGREEGGADDIAVLVMATR